MSKLLGLVPLLLLGPVLLAQSETDGLCPDLGIRVSSPAQGASARERDGEDVAELRVVSLNIHGVRSAEEISQSLGAEPELADADLYLLQEVEEVDSQATIEQLGAQIGFHSLFAAAERREEGQLHGLAILSRFPLREASVIRLPYNRLRVNTRCRIALAATVDAPAGRIRAVNLHLDTRINSQKRLEQLQPILGQVDSFAGPVILGGDFNTQDFQWVGSILPIPRFRRQAKDLRRLMESRDFVTPFVDGSKTHSWAPLKLDWIFLRDLEVSGYGLEDVGISDHRALWVTVAR